MMPKEHNDEVTNETVVVSFRLPRSVVRKIDEIASGDTRSRANFIARILSQAVSLEPGIRTVESIQKLLCDEVGRNPNSIQAEYVRGSMHGARWMLAAFFGDRAVRWVNHRAREKTGLPMPNVLPMQADGERYGFDSEADF